MTDLKGRRALVTGASSGIGVEIARDLASRGCDLVITARRRDRLVELAKELVAAHGVEVEVVDVDLGDPDAPRRLLEAAYEGGEIDILANNAGAGPYLAFTDTPWERVAGTIQLNVTSLVELTHAVVRKMLARGSRAYVMNVASIAAFMPVPYFSIYAPTKAFVRDFSEALAFELRDTAVTVTCVCPGGTATEFSDVAGQRLGKVAQASMMTAQQVAQIGVRAMLRGRGVVVTGLSNRFMCFLTRFLPRGLFARGAVAAIGKPADATEG